MSHRLFVSVLTLSLLAGCAAQPTPPEDRPLVRTVAFGGAGSGSNSYTGTIRARTESDLGFRVGGKIVQRLVDAGDVVRAGQPLMRIDPTDLGLAASAAADRVRAAAADAARASADLKRLEGLVEAGAISASQRDAARAAAAATAANLAAAQAQARDAGNARSYSILRADADGVVMATLADSGQVVAAGTPVIRLARSGPREAAVDVPETQLAGLPPVARATLYGSGATFTARLRVKSASADPLTRTFAARYVLDGPPPPLGATVTVTVDRPATAASATVPLAALVTRDRGTGVWAVRNGMARFAPVRVLTYGDETAEVAAPLPAGERIVALGAQLLRDGQKVRLAEQGR